MNVNYLRTAFWLFGSLVVVCLYPSCDLINPDEQIPSFIHIDSISLTTAVLDEGPPDHKIVDAWVYENEQLVGVYELPADIPVFAEGATPIRIRPGIKVNGQVGNRSVNPFMKDHVANVTLYPDSHVVINPTVTFQHSVTFDWIETFDDPGVTIESTTLSEADPTRITGTEAYQGKTALFHLNEDQNRFEVRSTNAFALDGGGPILLEFTYRCNNSLVVGLYSRDGSQTIQVPILVLSPTEEWNHVYVSFSDLVASSANFIDHRPFFGFYRDEDQEGGINVYVDNIRLMH